MRKLLSILLVLAMLFSACVAFAEEKQTDPVIWVVRAVSNMENRSDNEEVYQKIKELSGVELKLVVIPQDSWMEKSNMMLISGEDWDVMNIVEDKGNWSKYYQKDALQTWDAYFELMPNYVAHVTDEMLISCRNAEGETYALPRSPAWPKGGTPAIREDWLEALNMETPTTIKELEAYFAGVAENDMNGNGDTTDEIPFLPFVGIEDDTFRPYFMGFNGDRYLNDAGEIVPWYMHENTWLMLETLQKWYANGWMQKDYLTTEIQQGFDLVTANRVGGWFGPWNAGVRPASAGITDDVNMVWTSVSNLTDYPEGGGALWYSEPEYLAEIVLNKHSKNADWACKYLDWVYASVDNYMLCTYGIEGKHWEYANEEKTQFTKLEASANYYGFYALNEWYDYSLYPVEKVDENNYISKQADKLRQKILTLDHVIEVDYYVPYDFTGTDAEMLSNDGDVLIEEAVAKSISGEWGETDWNKAVETAWKVDGSIRSKIWTEQYNAFVG